MPRIKRKKRPVKSESASSVNPFVDEQVIQYWVHPESDSLFTTTDGKHPGDTCEELTPEEYTEAWSRQRSTVEPEDSDPFQFQTREPRVYTSAAEEFGVSEEELDRRLDQITQGPKVTQVYNTRTRTWEPVGGKPEKPRPVVKTGDRRMPFGGHVGERIADLETRYLNWVLNNTEDKGNGLHADIKEELRNRNS